MKKRIALAMALVLALSMLTGCGSGEESGRAEESKMILGIECAEAVSLDIANGQYSLNFVIRRCLYEPLVHVDPITGEEEMRLADSYTVSDDNTVYTFKLKPDVKMHDGSVLNADDVVYSLNMTKESEDVGKNLAAMESAKALDDQTVEVTLAQPYAAFMKNLSMVFILSADAYEEKGADGFDAAPVGCGPYKFVSYENDNKITLEAFEDYYREPAPIKTVEIRQFADTNALAIAMEGGELDAAAGLNPVDYENVASNDNIEINEIQTTKFCVMTMNNEKAPFDNKKVRQAINYAIDRAFVLDAAREGKGNPTSLLFNTSLACTEGVAEYECDVEKAKELLKEAGIKLPMKLDAKLSIAANCKTEAEAVQESLSKVGIEVEIEILEAGALYGGLATGDVPLALIRLGTSAIDADQYYDMVSKNGFSSLNYARYVNDDVEKLMIAARSEQDETKRNAIYKEALEIIQEDAPYAMVYEMPDLNASVKNLNVNWGLNGMYYLYDFSWK